MDVRNLSSQRGWGQGNVSPSLNIARLWAGVGRIVEGGVLDRALACAKALRRAEVTMVGGRKGRVGSQACRLSEHAKIEQFAGLSPEKEMH